MMTKRAIHAERCAQGVRVWWEGDDIASIFFPHTPGYTRWAAVADLQAAPAKGRAH